MTMAKTPVGRYGFINAKLRARISKILEEPLRESLIKAGSLEEALQCLEGTAFSSLFAIYDKTGDLQAVEAELFRFQIEGYNEICHHTEGSVRDFVQAMTVRLEIENLKNILRLWFGSKIKKRPIGYRAGYLYSNPILHPVSWDFLINALTYEDILKGVENTPYRPLLDPFRETPVGEGGIFRIETSLDRFYYRFLSEKREDLPREDRAMVLRIMETEVDLQNLSWILRYSRFYNMGIEDLLNTLIPGGYKFTPEDLKPFLERGDSREGSPDPGTLLSHRYPSLGAVPPGAEAAAGETGSARALLFEQLLEETRRREFMKIITGYPFTIGIILVYFFLKDRETRFLRGVLNGKYYGWGIDRIRGYLR